MARQFGWIPEEQRTKQQQATHEMIVSMMEPFFIAKQTKASDRQRVLLWDAPLAVLGTHIPTLRQMTGACVGYSAWNVIQYLMCNEIAAGDRERYEMTFLPYPYGRGRLHSGIRGRGDGSIGSGQAKALTTDGVILQSESDLPTPSGAPGELTWGQKAEMDWSDGRKIAQKWIDLGKQNVVQSAARVTTYQQVRDALANRYPVQVCSSRGFKMRLQKDKGKMWGVPSGRWMHALTFIAVDDDPARPGCYSLNTWSDSAHDAPIDGAPPGGFWVDADVANYMVSQKDSYAYSQFVGFPEFDIDFSPFG